MKNLPLKTPGLAFNFLLLSGGEAISKVLTFLAFAHLARVLNPDNFGAIEFALAVTVIFTLLVEFGSDRYGAIEVAKDKSRTADFVAHIVAIRCLLAGAAYVLLVGLVFLLNKPWSIAQITLLYGLTLFGVPGLLRWVFQGHEQMQWIATTSILRYSIFSAGVFLWVKGPEQIWLVPVVDIVAVACTVLFNLVVYQRYFGSIQLRLEPDFSRAILRPSLPLCLSQMMMALKLYLATIFLSMMMDDRTVGWFGSAHRLVLALNTFGGVYLFNLLPAVARCAQQPLDNLHHLMKNSIRVSTWAAVFIGIFTLLFAEPLMHMIYGRQYEEGIIILQVLIWLVLIALLSGHYRFILIGWKRGELDLISTAIGTGATAALSPMLISRYGPLGAAWAILCSEALTWALAYYFVRRKIMRIPILSHLVRPMLACVVVVVVLRQLPDFSFWLAGGTATVLYIASLLLLQPSILADVRSLR